MPQRLDLGKGRSAVGCSTRLQVNRFKQGERMKRAISSIVVLTLTMAACIHKPSGPVSPWERVNVNMAALAQINEDVAKGVIAAQQAGVVTAQQAAPILNYQEVVAKDQAAIENILAAGSAQA